jgi:putative inorganic carbon (HCO3(-)) transporter
MENYILFLAAYLPFQLALSPAADVDLASIRVLVLALFLAWLACGLKNKKVIVRGLQSLLVLTFLFFNALSVIMAKNTDWSWRKLLFLFSLFPVYFIVAATIDSRKKALRLVKFLVASGAAVAAVGIIQFAAQFVFGLEKVYKFWAGNVIGPFLGKAFGQAVLQNPSWLVNIAGETYLRATATFPDPHMLAFYLGLLIPLALGVVFSEKKQRFFWLAALGALLLCDLLTFSRGGYLGLFAGAATMLFLWWNKIGRSYKFSAVALAGLMIAALLVPGPISQRFYSSFDFQEGSNAGRIAIWGQALQVSENNPLLGVGIGNYPLAIKASADYREPIYAHNTYLDIAVETGIVNALVWAGLLLAAFLKFSALGEKDIFFLTCAVSIVIFAAHSMVETAVYSPTVLVLLLFIIGFSNIRPSDEKNI